MQSKVQLVSSISFVHGTDLGSFDSASEAVEHALFCGLPGEEMRVVNDKGVEMMKIVCPADKMFEGLI